jgi:cobalt-zinc-cadmium efflux system membrane fusion protein
MPNFKAFLAGLRSTDSGQTKSLSPRLQVVILGIVLAGVVVIGLVITGLNALLRSAPPPTPVVEPGVFQPTAEQMSGLKVQTIGTSVFRTEYTTDGKVALDDDITTPVFSPYSGRVVRLLAKPGDIVAKGAPLFSIQASEFVQGETDLVAAAEGLKTASAQLKLAQANEKRQHEVYAAKGGAEKDWLQSQSDLVAAEDAERAAATALSAVRNRLRILGRSDSEIDAEMTGPRDRINPEVVAPSPISGTVIQRQIAVGQYINSAANGASTPVFSIGDLSKVWVVGNVRENHAPFVKVGDEVEARVPAYPDRIIKARLNYVGAVIDDTTRRITARAEVENADGALKPEMFARIRIIAGDPATAVAAPDSAIVYEGESAHVWVVRDDGKIALRQVRPGRSADGLVEILDGLKAGEKVVTGGTLFIDRAGQND